MTFKSDHDNSVKYCLKITQCFIHCILARNGIFSENYLNYILGLLFKQANCNNILVWCKIQC